MRWSEDEREVNHNCGEPAAMSVHSLALAKKWSNISCAVCVWFIIIVTLSSAKPRRYRKRLALVRWPTRRKDCGVRRMSQHIYFRQTPVQTFEQRRCVLQGRGRKQLSSVHVCECVIVLVCGWACVVREGVAGPVLAAHVTVTDGRPGWPSPHRPWVTDINETKHTFKHAHEQKC